MKITKNALLLCLCIISFLMLGACSLFDDEHISKDEAQEIANDLLGSDVTYVKMEETDDPNHINYIFTDSNGYTFTISSKLLRPSIDGAVSDSLPLYCYIGDNYGNVVLKDNADDIMQILKKYSLEAYIDDDFPNDNAVALDVYVGTQEENLELLKNIATAAAEIDALLNITYDTDYYLNNADEYSSSLIGSIPTLEISFYTAPADENSDRHFEAYGKFEFSSSADTRLTYDSLYKEITKKFTQSDILE